MQEFSFDILFFYYSFYESKYLQFLISYKTSLIIFVMIRQAHHWLQHQDTEIFSNSLNFSPRLRASVAK